MWGSSVNKGNAMRVLVHALAWGTFLFLPVLTDAAPEIMILRLDRWSIFVSHGSMTLTLMVFYYLNGLVLAPRYLLNDRKPAYIAAVLICLIGYVLVNLLILQWLRGVAERAHGSEAFLVGLLPWRIVPIIIFFVVAGVLSTGHLIGDAYNSLRMAQEASRKELLELELDQLRTRMDPHFFFNALNTIYGLAELKDERTAQATLRLSHLMRRVLEAPLRKRVPLEEEVEHLRSYIVFQQLRSSGPNVLLKTDFPMAGLQISPLLLLPLVENAFKHGPVHKTARPTVVELRMNARNELVLDVRNELRQGGSTTGTGLGSANLRRRLNLEYPERHRLSTRTDDGLFVAELSLAL